MTNQNETAPAPLSVSENHSQSQVGSSFRQALAIAREQIDIEHYSFFDGPQAEEIALIIAEMYRLPPDCTVQIDGNKLPVEIVREIFRKLTFDHVSAVIDRYREIRYEIQHPKTYLRTALYNAVFEIEARTVNDVRSTL